MYVHHSISGRTAIYAENGDSNFITDLFLIGVVMLLLFEERNYILHFNHFIFPVIHHYSSPAITHNFNTKHVRSPVNLNHIIIV